MSLTKMTFDKVWTSRTDFPTYEPQEDKVRADIQYLFDSIKNQFNNFIENEFTSDNLVTDIEIGGTRFDDLAEVVEYIQGEIEGISEGFVADDSVSTAKLVKTEGYEAVTTETIRDGAVTGAKILDGTITADKLAPDVLPSIEIADGSITAAKLRQVQGTEAVVTNAIRDKAVTSAKINDYSIRANHLASEQMIDFYHIKNKAVTSSALDTSAVEEANLAYNAVTTAKIKDGAVTYAKTSGVQKQHVISHVVIYTSDWSNGAATVDALGTDPTNSNQVVQWSPYADTEWLKVKTCGIRAEPTIPAANKITFLADTTPTSTVFIDLCIWD